MKFLHIIEALDKSGLEYALVGGYAVALHGASRGTVDIDFVIRQTEEAFVTLERTLKDLGLESRLPVSAGEVFKFRKEWIQNRNLIAWSFYNPKNPIDLIDIIITEDLSVMKTKTIHIGKQKIKIIAIDDLIAMKRKAGRPQDLADVAALEKLKR